MFHVAFNNSANFPTTSDHLTILILHGIGCNEVIPSLIKLHIYIGDYEQLNVATHFKLIILHY